MSFKLWIVAVTLGSAACTTPMAPSSASTAAPASASGTWNAVVSDPTGSLMGSGAGGIAGASSWTLMQSGQTISGTWDAPGMMRGRVTMTGTFDGHAGTFEMTMPTGAMMGPCAASAHGTFEMSDDHMELRCEYSGSNTCSGPFQHGEMVLHR